MPASAPDQATLDDWIARHAFAFSLDSPERFNAAVDRLAGSLDGAVQLLGLGEAMHGAQEFLVLRNRLFQRLAEAHGYSAIAVESSFPRGRIVNDYVLGGEAEKDLWDAGFSHGFGKLEANRQLIEWMRQYNADPAHRVKLSFYGFDSPTEMTVADSPRKLLHFALDYLSRVDAEAGRARKERIDALLGDDAAWENPAAAFDPGKSIGQSPAATALRIETEELIAELSVRVPQRRGNFEFPRPRPGHEGGESHQEALHYAKLARQMLSYHAGMARPSDARIAYLLGLRDLMMAENLVYIVTREQRRGKVLAFAHNHHLQRGVAHWQLGPHALAWHPAGAHLHEMLGPGYAVIGAAVGTSQAHAIGAPEPGSLEQRLSAAAAPASFIPTHRDHELPSSFVDAIPTRTGSTKNTSYFPLTARSITDFDWLVMLNESTAAR